MNFLQEVNLYVFSESTGASSSRRPNIKRIAAKIEGDNNFHFRIPDDRKRELAEEFHTWRSKGSYMSSEKRLEVFLSMMSSGGYYRQVGHIFGLAKSTVFEHTHEVVEFLYDIAGEWIRLPTEDEYALLTSDFTMSDSEQKSVLLYVDGSIIRIMRPDHANDSFYCGRGGKHCDSLNAQIIVDKYGNVRHVVTGLSGKYVCYLVHSVVN